VARRFSASDRSADAERIRRKVFVIATAAVLGIVALLIFWPWNPTPTTPGGLVRSIPNDDDPDGGGDLPYELTRDQVRDVLQKVAPAVSLCGGGEGGEIRVYLEVSGATGQVKHATVAKQFSGTASSRCTIKMVEVAQFPRFRKKTLTVVFPFTFLKVTRPPDGGALDGGGRDGSADQPAPDPESAQDGSSEQSSS